MPDLDSLHRKDEKKGLVILALSDESTEKIVPFAKEGRYGFPFLFDTGGGAAKRFRVDGIPKSFVFDREGKGFSGWTEQLRGAGAGVRGGRNR